MSDSTVLLMGSVSASFGEGAVTVAASFVQEGGISDDNTALNTSQSMLKVADTLQIMLQRTKRLVSR